MAFFKNSKNLTVRQLTFTALMTALLCILGPVSLPLGPVPVSLTNFMLYVALYLLGTKFTMLSYLVYLLLGMAGLPVFSGYSGGLSKLAGPTGGYLIGFFFLLAIGGFFLNKFHYKTGFALVGFTLGTLTAYAFGTVWFMLQAGCSFFYALSVCVFPFFILDVIKIMISAKLGQLLRSRLISARLLLQKDS